jgi:hypothetical protein
MARASQRRNGTGNIAYAFQLVVADDAGLGSMAAASGAGLRPADGVGNSAVEFATHTYLLHPDETFQYLEPAYRLAFGAGVITWEFIDGIRSWLLPVAIAGFMRLAGVFTADPSGYIVPLRLLCVAASLSVPFAGYRLVFRRCGTGPAIAAGLLCALSPQAVWFAPVIMTEPLAADIALLAICFGEREGEHPLALRRLLLVGALFGLASALRYQYAPVLVAVALLQHARDRRACCIVAATGTAVVLLLLGVLDTIAWGSPFQSVWLNYLRNGPQGVSQAMGEESQFTISSIMPPLGAQWRPCCWPAWFTARFACPCWRSRL